MTAPILSDGARARGALLGRIRAPLRRVPAAVWPFVVLTVVLVCAVIASRRLGQMSVLGAGLALGVVVEWSNVRRRGGPHEGPLGSLADRLALVAQLATLLAVGSVAVLAALVICGVAVPSWAGGR